jgi:hypothetical protein
MTKEMWQVFFDIDVELWFHFTRDSLGNLMRLRKRTHQFIDAKTSDSIKLQINNRVYARRY